MNVNRKQIGITAAIVVAGLLVAGAAMLLEPADHGHGPDHHDAHGHDDAHAHQEGGAGSVTLAADMAHASGVVVARAGPARIGEALTLTGVVQPDPARVARVSARYPGIVTELRCRLLQRVARGAVLARVQSNDSLETYAVTAPIGGVVTELAVHAGGASGDDPMLTIVDPAAVWVELDAFESHVGRLRSGQEVAIESLEGEVLAAARLSSVAPVVAHGSQTVRVIVAADNRGGRLRIGQFVRARVTIAEREVAVAVAAGALQRVGTDEVVFVQDGDRYRAQRVDIGVADGERVEIRRGLTAGARYVAANSYLLKADLEKSAASHDH